MRVRRPWVRSVQQLGTPEGGRSVLDEVLSEGPPATLSGMPDVGLHACRTRSRCVRGFWPVTWKPMLSGCCPRNSGSSMRSITPLPGA